MKNLLIFLALLVLGLQVLKITMLNNLSIENIDYNKLTQKVRNYHKENIILSDKLLEQTALTTIKQKADVTGFKKGSILFLP